MVLIVAVILAFITIQKLKDFPPNNNCCRNPRNASSNTCWDCREFNLFEKIIHVWRYPAEVKPAEGYGQPKED